MQISEYFRDDLVFLDLEASSKEETIRKMSAAMEKAGVIPDADRFFKEVMEREKLGTTAVGHGVALPHARTEKLNDIVVAFARLKEGVDFGADDGEPVRLVFLIGTPLKEVNRYLKLLASLSRALRKPEVREALLKAATPEDVRETFDRAQQDEYSSGLV